MLARKLGSYVLTETMELAPEIGLDSYDRFFPNQDTLAAASFGSLIALPLQKRAREFGNSVFIDEDFVPYPDQWAFLCSIRRMNRLEVEAVVDRAQARGREIGVQIGLTDEEQTGAAFAVPRRRSRSELQLGQGLPSSLSLVLSNEILIEKESLPAFLHNRLIRLAAFQNPEFQRAQAMRRSAFGLPRIVACAQDYPHHIGLPRGCLDDVLELLSDLKVSPIIRDERFAGRPIAATFQGELTPEQTIAAEAMLAHDMGVLSATTSFGKTVIGAWLIAKRGVNTLVLVHRRQLQDQWIERLAKFLGLPRHAIGRVGGGKRKLTGAVDVAVIQSLIHKGAVRESVRHYGQLIVDECHHLSARALNEVARAARAKFIAGLSATVTRKDGHHPIVFMQCGPVRHRVDARLQAVARPFDHTAFIRPTGFRSLRSGNPDVRLQFHELYDALIADEERNHLICSEVVQTVRNGRSPIVLTERNNHLDELASRLSGQVGNLVVLRGGMSRSELDRTNAELAAIPGDEDRVLVATGRFIGEGFDDARLDTLFLTLPVSWHGTIAQYVGRLHRLYDGKREVNVYDYADINVPMLSRMFERRCRGYRAVGYEVQVPASAVPGWPSEVALPVDPEWKGQYATSVRRLVRDGLDRPLAQLFVQGVENDTRGCRRRRTCAQRNRGVPFPTPRNTSRDGRKISSERGTIDPV